MTRQPTGNERRALMVPVDASRTHAVDLPSGAHRLRFSLDRVRYRVASPDTTSNYRATATITLDW